MVTKVEVVTACPLATVTEDTDVSPMVRSVVWAKAVGLVKIPTRATRILAKADLGKRRVPDSKFMKWKKNGRLAAVKI